MAYVKLASPPTIGNTTQNTGQFSTVGVGAAATTSALYINATNRIGTWITGSNVSTGSDADGLFVDASFAPSSNVTNAASIGLYPTFAPPVGVAIANGYGLYIAAGTQSGAGTVTTGYGLFVTAPAYGTANKAASIGGLVIDSGGTGTISAGVWNGTTITVAKGGTGAVTLTGVLIGNGTSAVTANAVTQYDVLVGGASNAITSVAPSATSGIPLVSGGASADPSFTTAVVAGGGTGAVTLTGILTGNGTSAVTANAVTQHGVLIAGASNAASSLGVAATGTVLTGVTGADPAFSATPTVTSITFGSGNALNSYISETSWTPVLKFGGGTTGITYSTQAGFYIRIGNLCFFTANLVLSNKGSSTGNATITLPINNATVEVIVGTNFWSNITLAVLNTNISGFIQSNIININQTGSSVAQSAVADTNFANNSSIYFSGVYFV